MAIISLRGEKKYPDQAGEERALDKLLDIIQFTEEIATKITPFMNEGTIFNTLVEEFRRSDRYGLTILKLTDDQSRLFIVETAIKAHLIRAAEKLVGIKIDDFTIDYRESEAFRRVVLGGETIQVEYSRIIEEAVSSNPVLRKVVGQIVNILHINDRYNILTPLRRGGEVIGVLEISSTDLGELFIPSVRIFGLHVSRTLDLAREHEEGIRARRALEKNEEVQNSIFTSLEDGIFILSKDFRFTYWNSAMERFLGRKWEEVAGKDTVAWEIFPESLEEHLEDPIRRAMEGEVVHQDDVPYKMENGKEGYTSIILLPLRAPERKIPGIVGVIREVTDHKETRENLRISEEKYRLLVENANEAIVVARQGVIQFANPKASEITGYSNSELDQKPITDLIHPDDVEMVLDRHRRRSHGEEIQNIYSFRILDKEGQTRCLEINAVSFNWEGMPSTLNFLTDITDRRKAEYALIESEEKWRSWVENAPDKITTLDRDGNILFVNHMPAGFVAEEVLGNSIYDYMEAEERSRMRSALEVAFGHGRVTRYESTFTSADGSKAYFENSVGPVKKGKDVLSVILVSRDTTERKNAEEALRNSEERMHALFETMAEGVIVLNSEGRIVEANHAAERILGVDRSRIKSRDYVGPDWESIRPDGSKMPISEIPSALAMREKRSVKEVVMGIKRSGAPVAWLSVSAVPFSRMAGKETGVVTTFSDITRWKKIKEELGRKTDYLQRIIEASPGAIAVTDQNGIIVECNQAIVDLHGFDSRDQILGKTVFSLTAEREHERLRMGFMHVADSGSVRISPLALLDKAGNEIQVELTGSIVKDPTGSPGRFIAILRRLENAGSGLGRTLDERVGIEA